MPTSASIVYTEDYLQPAIAPDLAVSVPYRLKPSTTFPKGCTVGIVTADGTAAPYANGNSDGSETAVGFLKRACITDADGRITFGSAANGMEHGQTHLTADVWVGGLFYTADIPQTSTGALDANGVTDLKGKIVKGTLADGILSI
jgi:hypothetical protein